MTKKNCLILGFLLGTVTSFIACAVGFRYSDAYYSLQAMKLLDAIRKESGSKLVSVGNKSYRSVDTFDLIQILPMRPFSPDVVAIIEATPALSREK